MLRVLLSRWKFSWIVRAEVELTEYRWGILSILHSHQQVLVEWRRSFREIN